MSQTKFLSLGGYDESAGSGSFSHCKTSALFRRLQAEHPTTGGCLLGDWVISALLRREGLYANPAPFGYVFQTRHQLKTTNCIENVMRQVGIYKGRVSYWNSNQRQRWVRMALQEIEPKLRVVRGYRHLKELREAMKNLILKKHH